MYTQLLTRSLGAGVPVVGQMPELCHFFHNDADSIVCLGKDIVDMIFSHVGMWEEGEGSQVQ